MNRLALAAATVLSLAACTPPTPPTPPSAPAAAQSAPAPPAPPSAPIPPPAPTAAVPARFQGEWNTDTAACGVATNDSRLLIGADRVQFHESSGPVRSAAANGDDLALVVELTGEGQTFERDYRFHLSDNDNTLTDLGNGMARKRCP